MTTSVSVLGTGIMGAGMARSMARAGLGVTAWNRSFEKARPLAEAGVTVAEDLRAAVAGQQVVVTMLFDTDSVAEVLEPVLPSFAEGAVWVQASTVGLAGTDRLAGLAREHGIAFVDAPVLGTRKPAENGTLTVLAGGPRDLLERVAPVFDAIGSRTIWVGEQPGDGHRLKLVANAWVQSVVAGTAQSIALARGLGLDPHSFLETIAGGALDCAYVQLKGGSMIEGAFPPAFTVSGAVKDSALIRDALRDTGTDDRLMDALHGLFSDAAVGHADEDMAAVYTAFRAGPE